MNKFEVRDYVFTVNFLHEVIQRISAENEQLEKTLRRVIEQNKKLVDRINELEKQ